MTFDIRLYERECGIGQEENNFYLVFQEQSLNRRCILTKHQMVSLNKFELFSHFQNELPSLVETTLIVGCK